YQAWRRLVVAELRDPGAPFNVIVLDGQTGSGKTKILEFLDERGIQTLDLEGLANHRGSVFGGFEATPQPSQKLFESLVWERLSAFDAEKPTVLEAESNLIGRLSLPDRLMQSMQIAPRIEVRADVGERARYLLEAYGDIIACPERLVAAIERLRPFHAKSLIDGWLARAQAAEFERLAGELMQSHYDPLYDRQRNRRCDRPFAVFSASDLCGNGLAGVAGSIAELLSQQSDVDARQPRNPAERIVSR
ncbi:MAG: tRNA 2-selenouridine(34) synthase MnmH, partial [Pseudomonadota bacterium]